MNPLIQEIYRSGFVEDAGQNRYPHHTSSVMYETGQILYEFIRQVKPRRTLEIGMAYGLSTLFICQALADNGQGSHTVIDPHEETGFHAIGLLNIERAGLQAYLRFYPRPSFEVLAELAGRNERFDFAFVDGSHLFDFVLVDFFFIDRLLETGGYVVFDDLWMPAVRKVVSFVLRNKAYELTKPAGRSPDLSLPRLRWMARRFLQDPLGRDWHVKLIPYNIAILRKTAEDERTWSFHRPF